MSTQLPPSQSPTQWHPALRWLAILPAMGFVYFATALICYITAIFFKLFGYKTSPDDFSVLPFLYSAFGGYAMVLFAYALAPTGKRYTAVIASVIVVVVCILSLVMREGTFVSRLIDIAMLGGACFAGFKAKRGKLVSTQGL